MKLTVYFGVSLYSNRIVNEDLSKASSTLVFENINFIEGDGINTSQVLNGNVENIGTNAPSYVKVENEDETLNSYWWVMRTYKNRANQVTLYLRRDFLRQYWDLLKDYPFICEKASSLPPDVSDARYRKTMNLSQVKTHEYLLREDDDINSGRGWIVVYFAKTTPENENDDVWDTTVTGGDLAIQLRKDHPSCKDSPCDILAIPLGGHIKHGSADYNIQIRDFSQLLPLVYALSIHFGSWIYDIQYLPYVSQSRGSITSELVQVHSVIFETTIVSYAIWLTESYFSETIANNDFSQKTLPDDSMGQRKLEEETLYRLSSPNYASSFEFSVVKNGGYPSFDVYGILRPYSPYFYIEPQFEGIYGSSFDDGRGLVFAGDFSLDQISNAWTQYKLNNKNYQLTFDREIQSLDLKNSYATSKGYQNIIKAGAGVLGGTLSGMLAGAKIGGPVGMAIGGVAGVATSGANLAFTAGNMEQEQAIRDDQKDAMIDNFQYQIGNIQAIPNTLNKVSALNQNFKIFPIVEEYKCTPQESINMNLSVTYSGIDVNLVCSLSSFEKGFVSGSLIQFPPSVNLNDEQARSINSELQYGIYIKSVG